MFVLRKISGDGIEMNIFLGRGYTWISKEKNPKEFERTKQQAFDGEVGETTYGFLTDEGGKNCIQLYDGQLNFIMSDSGKTFANLTKSYGIKKPD